MTAFYASVIITVILCGVVYWMAKRRTPGQPLTWGEAFVAGTFLFFLMLMLYGVVPNQWLQWADKDLKWRSDKLGIPVGPLKFLPHNDKNLILGNGIRLPGSDTRGRILLNAQILRDIIAATMYIAFLAFQCWAWLWWQKRGKTAPKTPELQSAFGRPLAKKA